jgi:uncharacterized protein YjbI with pentapeptide repeats
VNNGFIIGKIKVKIMDQTFENQILKDQNFVGKDLRKNEYLDCQFINCNFSEQDLNSCAFLECSFTNCDK